MKQRDQKSPKNLDANNGVQVEGAGSLLETSKKLLESVEDIVQEPPTRYRCSCGIEDNDPSTLCHPSKIKPSG